MGLFASDNPVLFSARPEMLDFESGQGRSDLATAVVVVLRIG
jgi:hypothetical protein